MYTLQDYGNMIADRGRTLAYAQALAACVAPSSVVLDIGTGAGIFAMLACRAGARKVYAVESEDIIQIAKEAAAANGFAERIEFLQTVSTAIDLPEKADVVVADVHGSTPMFGRSLISILDARDRLLAPRGAVIPAQETLWAALVCSPEAHASVLETWSMKSGFDLKPASDRAINEWHKQWLTADQLIVEPTCWATLDYLQLQSPGATGQVSWTIDAAAHAHAVVIWFDCQTATGIGFSNSPLSGERHVYGQSVLWWPAPVSLLPGDKVSVRLRADFAGDEYIWRCETRVVDGGGGDQKVAFRQSTWDGTSLSADRLRRRASTFVPILRDDGEIDARILQLMTQGRSLGDIAEKIVAAFPSSFGSLEAALTRVGNVSERYSK
jgi:protein arginine N-methyltransferase 1